VPEIFFDRWCDEIVHQTDLLHATLADADLTLPVPTCPGWDLGQLVRHLGAGQRWAEEIVRTRASGPLPDDPVRRVEGGGLPVPLGEWLADGARRLAATLREAGPWAEVWTPLSGGNSAFYARRFAYETLVHRADATLARGREFTVEVDLAVDALDEHMELGSLAQMFEFHPDRRELLGPGRTLHFHATGASPDAAAEWVVDLTGEVLAWRRAHEKSAVAVRGPLTALLLLVYGRMSLDAAPVEVLGDRALLEFWLARNAFG
jgi:uncharacterized protein (TIGR03083 family)